MNQIVELFRKITTGVYVVGVAHDGARDAFTATSLVQVSYRPLLLALAINPKHASYPLLRDSGTWTVNILRAGELELARRFGTPPASGSDKLAGSDWGVGRLGAPILKGASAYFDCRLVSEVSAGDHQVVIGKVIGGSVFAQGFEPLLYAATGNLDQSASLFPSSFESP
jgi:flavin reductase (DIM6/NTAB) family NADH-FMN oxidoreductase RutF